MTRAPRIPAGDPTRDADQRGEAGSSARARTIAHGDAAKAQRSTILIVEDSRPERMFLDREIRRCFPDCRVEIADSLQAARSILDQVDVAVSVTDYLLGDATGFDLIDSYPRLPSILVTGSGSEQLAAEALRRGAVDYVVKEQGNRHFQKIERAVAMALEHFEAARAHPPEAVAAEAGDIVRFGSFELDLDHRQLREDRQEVTVHETPMRLLVHLVRNAGRTISKQELLSEVWRGILVSDTAIASALKELRHLLHDSGARQHVIQTHRGSGYCFAAPVSVAASSSEREAGASGMPSLAVIPLEDLSASRGRDRLALEWTDALTGALAQLAVVRVISRASVSDRQRGATSLRDLGRALDADLFVLGSLARSGNHLRIHVELVDARSESVIWAGQFDPQVADSFESQNAIVRGIAREVKLELTPRAGLPLHSDPVTPSTQGEFLMGMYQHLSHSPESFWKALHHFQRALELSPRYAPAHVAVAECYQRLCSEFCALPAKEAIPLARAAADRALELDPMLGEAHAVHGSILAYFEWRWPQARGAFERALELSPGDPACLIGFAKLRAALGETEGALELGRRAVAGDPLNLSLRLTLARLLWCDRRYDESLTEQRWVAAMEPGMAAAHADSGASLYQLGRFREAVEHWSKTMAVLGISAELREALQGAFDGGGIGAYWRRWLEAAVSKEGPFPPVWMWFPHASSGDLDRAFACLEDEVERRVEEVAYLKSSPLFDVLRGDPRFGRLLARMRLGEP